MTPSRNRLFGTALALHLLLPGLLAAQTTYTTANTPYPLDNLGHSPRSYALGDAFAAVWGDPSCLFYNPAGLCGISGAQISIVHQSWVADISQETLLAAIPLEKAGALAIGVNYLNFGTLDGYDTSGNPTSSNHPFRGNLILGWGGPLGRDFSIGLGTREQVQSLSSVVSTASYSFQAGAFWRPLPHLDLGASYSFMYTDASPDLGFLRLGAAYSTPLFLKEPALVTADFTLPLYNVARLQLGAEQKLLAFLLARAGFQWEIDDNYIGGFRGFTAGLGFDFHDWTLDYTYVPDGDLGFSQMIGLTYRFPAGTPQPSPAPAPPPLPSLDGTHKVRKIHEPPASPVFTPPPPFTVKPSPIPTSNPAVDFNPSATALPSDRVVNVETSFKIPDTLDSTAPAGTPSPELQKALDDAGQKVQQNPKDAKAWMDLGNLYWQTGQPDYAVQCFTEVLKLRPDAISVKDWLDRYQKAHAGPAGGQN